MRVLRPASDVLEGTRAVAGAPRRAWTAAALMATDAVALAVAALAAVALASTFGVPIDARTLLTFLPFVVCALVAFAVAGLYPGAGLGPVAEFRRQAAALAASSVIGLAVTALAVGSRRPGRGAARAPGARPRDRPGSSSCGARAPRPPVLVGRARRPAGRRTLGARRPRPARPEPQARTQARGVRPRRRTHRRHARPWRTGDRRRRPSAAPPRSPRPSEPPDPAGHRPTHDRGAPRRRRAPQHRLRRPVGPGQPRSRRHHRRDAGPRPGRVDTRGWNARARRRAWSNAPSTSSSRCPSPWPPCR